jgi:hypothetical protein
MSLDRTSRRTLLIVGAITGIVALVWLLLPASIREPTNADGAPREGIRAYPVFGPSFDGWREMHEDGYHLDIGDGSARLTIEASLWDADGSDGYYDWSSWGKLRRDPARDLSASVALRAATPDETATGCLMLRADTDMSADDHAFNFCIDRHGAYAYWFDRGTDANGYLDLYDDPAAQDALNPLDTWNMLKVIAKGERLWLYINDVYVGQAVQSGKKGGTVGIRVDAVRPDGGEFEFRRLTVRGVGWI